MAPIVSPDFSEAVEMVTLPAGTYKARVTGVESKTSQTSGNHYLNWKLNTFGNDKSELNNRVIFHSTPTTGKGAGYLKQFLMATTGELPNSSGFDTDAILGRELSVTVMEERNRDTGELTGYVRVKSVAPLK